MPQPPQVHEARLLTMVTISGRRQLTFGLLSLVAMCSCSRTPCSSSDALFLVASINIYDALSFNKTEYLLLGLHGQRVDSEGPIATETRGAVLDIQRAQILWIPSCHHTQAGTFHQSIALGRRLSVRAVR